MDVFKSLILFCISLLFISFSSLATTTLCLKTLEDYVKLRDANDSQSYKLLFTEMATFTIPALDVSIEGADQIAQRQATAVSAFKTQHMLTDVNIYTGSKAGSFTAESRFILIQKPRSTENSEKIIFNGKYVDELVLIKGKCLIEKRNVEIISRDTWF